jgi:predicted phosphoribosyltransferase
VRIVDWFPPLFYDRTVAGKELAAAFAELELDEPLILGLARGGVAVALELAQALSAPLTAVSVQRVNLGEHRVGATTASGPPLLTYGHNLPEQALAVQLARARRAAEVQEARLGLTRPPLLGREIVVVDDGLVTGMTLAAGCRFARAEGAGRVVAAIPVGRQSGLARLEAEADLVVCPHPLKELWVVGQAYDVFDPLDEWYVAGLLATERDSQKSPGGRSSGAE